jgi:hypothetical protein
MKRPRFSQAWQAFTIVNRPVAAVGTLIGGKVGLNIRTGTFSNACPTRISYVLNVTGFPITARAFGHAMVSGADGRWYLYRVPDMMDHLAKTFGPPDKTVRFPKAEHFKGKKGILAIRGHGWSAAVGHVTLWNGATCLDACHLAHDPDNGTFVPDIGSLWELP